MNVSNNLVNFSSETIINFANTLDAQQRDALKYKLSLNSIQQLENHFDVSTNPDKVKRFNFYLQSLIDINLFKNRLLPYGISYRGFPSFLSDEVLANLQIEAEKFRFQARPNFDQFLAQVDTENCSTFGEKLEGSKELHRFVVAHAGPCLPSYITSYIYYDSPGHCSLPHVDNAFTALTVMIGLKHECENRINKSQSIIYWPNSVPMKYDLKPGEMVIFFGTSMLHGRTPVFEGEIVHSMLLSFRPC